MPNVLGDVVYVLRSKKMNSKWPQSESILFKDVVRIERLYKFETEFSIFRQIDAEHVNRFLGLVFDQVKADDYVRSNTWNERATELNLTESEIQFLFILAHDHRLLQSQSNGG